MVLVLYELPEGYALLKIKNDSILDKSNLISKAFANAAEAQRNALLVDFQKFDNNTQSLAAATACVEGTVSEGLASFLAPHLKDTKEKIAVGDNKLAAAIHSKFNVATIHNDAVISLMRGIRGNANSLVENLSNASFRNAARALAHALSRHKLKYSSEKLDTMVVQAISLVDDVDKRINIYSMRLKEWYGWHFPELVQAVSDNLTYAKVAYALGDRKNFKVNEEAIAALVSEQTLTNIRDLSNTSMGFDITDEDETYLRGLAQQVVEHFEYREQLHNYLRTRMQAIAPNTTAILGEMIGARLIAHAGSIRNLAKFPASTIQLLGAEKALFNALKTKKSTPKYGIIYNATLVTSANAKNKGKIARSLASKVALGCRVDALAENTDDSLGFELRDKLEARLNTVEGREVLSRATRNLGKANLKKYVKQADNIEAEDVTADKESVKLAGLARPAEQEDVPEAKHRADEEVQEKPKKEKKDKSEKSDKKEKKDKSEKKEKSDKKDKSEKKDKKEKSEKKDKKDKSEKKDKKSKESK